MRLPVNGRITVRHNQWIHTRFYQGRHKGYDFAVPMNTPVASTSPGRVTIAGVQRGFGNVVYVQHGGLQVIYAHLNGFAVQAGQTVTEGQLIGYSGNSGWSTGPHLHWEASLNGVTIDPIAHIIPAPAPVGNFWVTVDKPVANVRSQPNSRAPLAGSKTLRQGARFLATGTVVGEMVNGNNVWWVSAKKNYVWSGGTRRV